MSITTGGYVLVRVLLECYTSFVYSTDSVNIDFTLMLFALFLELNVYIFLNLFSHSHATLIHMLCSGCDLYWGILVEFGGRNTSSVSIVSNVGPIMLGEDGLFRSTNTNKQIFT